MDEHCRNRPTRCLLTWLAATLTAITLAAWAAPDLAPPPPAASFEHWLTWLCAVTTAVCAGWGWVATSLVVLEALSGRTGFGAGVPRPLRRLVLGVCGAALAGTAAPAVGAPAAGLDDGDRRPALHGLPLPDRAEGVWTTHAVTRTVVRHRVAPGDSLWSVAEHALRAESRRATAADVAAYWPRIHARNRDVVGPDPDLLRPGQLLRLPALPDPIPGEDPR